MSDNIQFDDKKAHQVSCAFSIVLNDNGADLFHSSRDILKKFMLSERYRIRFIAVGFHDKDINDFGDKKTNHYHLVIDFVDKMRLISCFNYIIDLFHCNGNQISIEKCSDVGSQTRYILHYDHADKYQYHRNILITNSEKTADFYLSRITIHDEEDLINIVDRYPSRRKLLLVLGKKQYRDWYFFIRDEVR